MARLLFVAPLLVLVAARPETYRENEDFQFSRSSSDQGTKSGFYGAQRGNMGGNYERAHNMDSLAQNQMSGLVRQVEGEVGDVSNTRTGSVFTAANSRGVYGNGKYDLSNLEGRNFQEGVSYGDSQSSQSSFNSAHSGQSSSSHMSGYSAGSQNSRYTGNQGTKSSGLAYHAGNLQAANNLDGYSSGHNSHGYNSQSGYSSQTGYQAENRYQGQSSSDSSNSNLYHYRENPQSRIILATPVRVVGRPGSRYTIPVGIQTYDANQSGSSYDQNAINTEAELLNHNNQQIGYTPQGGAKHYESEYSYRKEWERHKTVTGAVPLSIPTTENPIPRNSELYEDSQAYQGSRLQSHNSQSSSASINNAHSASSTQSQYQSGRSSQSGFNSQHSNLLSGYDSNAQHSTNGAYNSGADIGAIVGDLNSKPKSYQSSYSYHKSWERQGDPYVIEPASNGLSDNQETESLTSGSASNIQGYSSQHGSQSQYRKSHQAYSSSNGLVCCENGHIRVARSVDQEQQQYEQQFQDLLQSPQWDGMQEFQQQSQNLEQMSQNQFDGTQDFNQQSTNLEQQSQDQLQDFGQQSQDLTNFSHDQLQDFGQQSQSEWARQSQDPSQQLQQGFTNENQQIQDLGQQSQDQLQDFGQQSQDLTNFSQDQLQDFGQQSQSEWARQSQDLGQQLQQGFTNENQQIQDLGQQSQSSWDKLEDLGQQSQDLSQQSQQSFTNQNQQTEDLDKGPWKDLQDFGRQTQHNLPNQNQQTQDLGKQVQTEFGQQSQGNWDNVDKLEFGQQFQNQWNQNSEDSNAPTTNTENSQVIENFDNQQVDKNEGQKSQNTWQEISSFDTTIQNSDFKPQSMDQQRNSWSEGETNIDQNQSNWSQISQSENQGQQTQDIWRNLGPYHRTEPSRNSQQDNNSNTAAFVDPWAFVEDKNKENGNKTDGMFSLQDIWDKIDNFDMTSINDKSVSDTKESNMNITQEHSSQDSYYSWNQSHLFENSSSTHNTYHNTHDSHSETNQHWHPTMYGGNANTSTTVRSIIDTELNNNKENERPQDIGRGDIGPEDGTETDDVPNKTPENHPIYVSESVTKPFKTPEEIESLSLINNKSSNEYEHNESNLRTNVSQNTENMFSVISLDQQRRLQQQNSSSTTSKYAENQFFIEQTQHQQHQESRNINVNNNVFQTPVEPISNNKPNKPTIITENNPEQIDQPNEDHLTNAYGQQGNKEWGFDQQSQGAWNQDQINQNVWGEDQQSQSVWGQNQQDQIQWGENFDNLNQQVQTFRNPSDQPEREQNEELEQQVQTAWKPNLNLEQQQTQDLGNPYERTGHGEIPKEDFYSQRYENQQIHQVENLDQSPPPAPTLASEPTTVQPGFWKSVGNKFSNAKDSVVSWFKRS